MSSCSEAVQGAQSLDLQVHRRSDQLILTGIGGTSTAWVTIPCAMRRKLTLDPPDTQGVVPSFDATQTWSLEGGFNNWDGLDSGEVQLAKGQLTSILQSVPDSNYSANFALRVAMMTGETSDRHWKAYADQVAGRFDRTLSRAAEEGASFWLNASLYGQGADDTLWGGHRTSRTVKRTVPFNLADNDLTIQVRRVPGIRLILDDNEDTQVHIISLFPLLTKAKGDDGGSWKVALDAVLTRSYGGGKFSEGDQITCIECDVLESFVIRPVLDRFRADTTVVQTLEDLPTPISDVHKESWVQAWYRFAVSCRRLQRR